MLSVIHETQATITEWAVATFGPDGSDFRIVARANDELAELLRAIGGAEALPCDVLGNHSVCNCDRVGGPCGIGEELQASIREEAADVAIVLARLAQRHGARSFPMGLEGGRIASVNITWQACHAAKRMAVLLMDTAHGGFIGDTYAALDDVIAAMAAICRTAGGDLQAEVDAKMATNRGREWNIDRAGRGYHVHKIVPRGDHLRAIHARDAEACDATA